MSGTVYLVGAGPGAADLLTLRAARLLARADVVVHDALVSAETLALAPQAQHYNVGKRANRPSVDQRFICRLLVRLASRNAVVVRLKGGDPHLFGRATEEIAACRAAEIPVVSIPGVSAGFASASAIGASLTSRGISRSVAFVTPARGRGESGDQHWAEAASAADTSVVYMGGLQAARVRDELLLRGIPAGRPVALVESASLEGERIVRGVLGDLPALAEKLGDGPTIMLIGDAFAEARAFASAVDAA